MSDRQTAQKKVLLVDEDKSLYGEQQTRIRALPSDAVMEGKKVEG